MCSSSLLDMNKEGVCSLFGYVVIYLLGVYVGSVIFSQKPGKSSAQRTIWRLVIMDMLCWAVYWIMCAYVQGTRGRTQWSVQSGVDACDTGWPLLMHTH
jgi:GWT1